jgi:hypothetical protein
MGQHERTSAHSKNVGKNVKFEDCSVCKSVHVEGSCPQTADAAVGGGMKRSLEEQGQSREKGQRSDP